MNTNQIEAEAAAYLRRALTEELTEVAQRHPKSAGHVEQALTVVRNTSTSSGLLALESVFYTNFVRTNSRHDRRVWRAVWRASDSF
jgi:hypothetical protein